MNTENSILRAKFFRRLNKNLGDYSANLCIVEDTENLPDPIKEQAEKSVPRNKAYKYHKTTIKRAYVTITGNNLPQLEYCFVDYYGRWIKSDKYGYQFKASSYSIASPDTDRGMIALLSSKHFKGIGTALAGRIVKEFGKDTLDVIEKTPDLLLRVKGITESKLESITSSYQKVSYADLAVFLGEYEIPTDTIVRIKDVFGEKAEEKIRENPHILQSVKGIGFKTCDRIARGINTALDCYERICGACMETLRGYVESTGNMFIRYSELEKHCLRMLNQGIGHDVVSSNALKECINRMQQEELIVLHRLSGEVIIYLYRYERAEGYTAKRLVKLLAHKPHLSAEKIAPYIDASMQESEITLGEEQLKAVKTSLSNRVSIISGGPGTGKTTIIRFIIDVYKKVYGGDVTLMAPSGKASSRLEQSSGYPAATIHSTLEIYEDGRFFEPRPLPAGLVVVDEASMVDSLVLESVMKAIVSDETFLVFVGDIAQLPSVGAGQVLNEMISSGIIPTTHLKEIFRQKDGSTIIENAKRINDGICDLIWNDEFRYVPCSSDQEAVNKVAEIYKQEVDVWGVDNVALLSPLRRTQGRFGCVSDNLNHILQDVVNPAEETENALCTISGVEYRLHDRVMQWKNKESSSNGDIGEILSISDDDELELKIRWDNGNTTLEDREGMETITLAYAMSVHKSQGSEYPVVIIPVLSEQHCRIMKKNLIYTGITRAKKNVIIVGDEAAIRNCIITNADSRDTLLARRINFNAKNN